VAKRRYILAWLLLSGIVSLGWTSSLFYEIYQKKSAVVWIERSIEILTPSVGEQERLRFRAMYRSIDSAKQFFELESSLRDAANKHNIQLPSFSSIR